MQPVHRTLQLLTAVSSAGPEGISISELSNLTGLSPSTIHRYVTEMRDAGYLQRGPNRELSLAGRALALGAVGRGYNGMQDRLRSALDGLRSATGETSFASQLAGTNVVCIAMEPGTYPLQLSVKVGQTIPPLHAASARAVLAYVDKSIVADCWAQLSGIERDITLTAFHDQLGQIRDRGYDICDSEFDHGVWAVAAPVFLKDSHQLFGALAIAGAAERFNSESTRSETIDLVVDTAKKLAA